ncbi:MFS transporter [Streptomyces sp. NPDC059863]|uniref:MFS transporter n=2 Tax=unclassified Streptomyces TaxID=2593676 RepID=UPI00364DEA1F
MTADPSEKGPIHTARVPASLLVLVTGGMGLSMFVLYAIGALGPFLIEDLDISSSQLGVLTAVTFGSATVLSLYAGQVADMLGGRRAFTVLMTLVAADFALLIATGTYWFLLAALVLGGAAQSLANPSTNKLITTHVPAERRAVAVGIKQSGVPLAAFTAGLTLPTLAEAMSWRAALALVIPVALAAALAATRLPRDTGRPARLRPTLPKAPNLPTRWLMAVSFCVGCGLSALNTYLPLYAHQRLSMGERSAGALIAAIGVSGIASRVLWSRLSDRLDVPRSLLILSVASVVSGALLPAATGATWLVWIGAVGLGCSAAAANAVSMVAVTQGSGFGSTGHASALVSMGFFAGFVVGPVTFGLLVDATGGFTAGWTLVTAVFAVAGLCSWGGRRIVRASV